MKNIRFYNQNSIPLSLSNLCVIGGMNSIELKSLIENCRTTKDLLHTLETIEIFGKFDVFKQTNTGVILVSHDFLGNQEYLEVDFDEITNSIEDGYFLKDKNIRLSEKEIVSIVEFYQYESQKQYIKENYPNLTDSEIEQLTTEVLASKAKE